MCLQMQSSLFSAAIAAVVFASATAINPARYVRIYDSQNDPSDYINLQLVTVYGGYHLCTPPFPSLSHASYTHHLFGKYTLIPFLEHMRGYTPPAFPEAIMSLR